MTQKRWDIKQIESFLQSPWSQKELELWGHIWCVLKSQYSWAQETESHEELEDACPVNSKMSTSVLKSYQENKIPPLAPKPTVFISLKKKQQTHTEGKPKDVETETEKDREISPLRKDRASCYRTFLNHESHLQGQMLWQPQPLDSPFHSRPRQYPGVIFHTRDSNSTAHKSFSFVL